MFCQLDYPDVPYGDKTIAENGCACCVMASAIGNGMTQADISIR